MPPETKTHRRKQFVLKIGFAARTEALVKCGGQHRGGDGLVDGRGNSPASFAGIGDAAREFGKRGIFEAPYHGDVYIVDANDGKETLADEEIDKLFVAAR